MHRYAGILSAFGMALADIVHEEQEPAAFAFLEENYDEIDKRITCLMQKCTGELSSQGHASSSICCEIYLNMRYEKTDFAIMVKPKETSVLSAGLFCMSGDFKAAFIDRYKREFGFSLTDRIILVDDIRVRGVAKSGVDMSNEIEKANGQAPIVADEVETFFEKEGFMKTSVYMLQDLLAGHVITGPAIISDANGTTLVEPGCEATITERGNIKIEIRAEAKARLSNNLDPIQLSIFSHRFMSIAEQMGRVLQRTAISTNIKERLDFSCALFGPDGGLVSNAPHIPVHLGMSLGMYQY